MAPHRSATLNNTNTMLILFVENIYIGSEILKLMESNNIQIPIIIKIID